jgi:hypothetical protein
MVSKLHPTSNRLFDVLKVCKVVTEKFITFVTLFAYNVALFTRQKERTKCEILLYKNGENCVSKTRNLVFFNPEFWVVIFLSKLHKNMICSLLLPFRKKNIFHLLKIRKTSVAPKKYEISYETLMERKPENVSKFRAKILSIYDFSTHNV